MYLIRQPPHLRSSIANRGALHCVALQQSKARLTHPLPVRLASEVPPTSCLPCLLYLPVHAVTGRDRKEACEPYRRGCMHTFASGSR